MSCYDAPSGSVWKMSNDTTIFVILDGHVSYRVGNEYRHAFDITSGRLRPFGKGSQIDTTSVRVA